MPWNSRRVGITGTVVALGVSAVVGQPRGQTSVGAGADPVRVLVGRLDVEEYKATIKGLTQFGDRLHGTDRNQAAVNWIEAKLRGYGCTNTERLKYVWNPPTPPSPPQQAAAAPSNRVIGSGEIRPGVGGSRLFGNTRPAGPKTILRHNATPRSVRLMRSLQCLGRASRCIARRWARRARTRCTSSAHTWMGEDLGRRLTTTPREPLWSWSWRASFTHPDVQTERSIRFALWNSEEAAPGSVGARAYVEQRATLQGREDPPGTGRYPEPRWLAMIQHDMMLWDHGMPRPDGTVNPQQRPEADVNIEFQSAAKLADQAMRLAFLFRDANEKYATDYPATVGHHMTNTDSTPFMDLAPAISLRENERGMQMGAGWNPHYHQATDVYSAYFDKDFRLGLNAAQTTLAAVARLAGANLKQ